jgi:lipid-A-disaccharide synthase
MTTALNVGIIAGEPSGDVLAAGLMAALKRAHPTIRFTGIGGKHMLAEGMQSLVDIEELSVMGLVEVLSRLPRLLEIKRQVLAHYEQDVPDVFIGVDAPDFNLRIETVLKQRGIKTVHYVSPTVWAWREKRIVKIAKATHLVLGLFPFEAPIYEQYGVPYKFVGHTLADTIPLADDGSDARELFELTRQQPVLALLPGSRKAEVASLLNDFIATANQLAEHFEQQGKTLSVLIPAANHARYTQIEGMLKAYQDTVSKLHFDVKLIDGQTRECLLASNAVLIASGTATLEAMLCKRPMVVAYKMSRLTRFIMGYLYKPKYFALPNILAEQALVTELLQQDVNPNNLYRHLLPLFGSQGHSLQEEFTRLHQGLRLNADQQAAQAVLRLVGLPLQTEET